MELRQLVYFEAVACWSSFTRAAEQLHVAQPAISAQIRRLESELAVTLLARTTRRVSLTSAGELFLARTQRVLGELAAARAELDELAAVLRGRICIGATQALGPFDLPGALSGFHALYPGVAMALRSGLIAGLLAALDAGDVDVVVGPIHADLASRYSAQPLAGEDLVVVTAPGHSQARKARLTLGDLRDEAFVCLPPGSGLRAILDEAAAAAGFEPCVPFETHSPTSIRELVSSGLGVALVARSVAQAPGPPIAIHVVHPAPTHPPIGLIHHRDRRLTPAAQTFSQHLQRAAIPISNAVVAETSD